MPPQTSAVNPRPPAENYHEVNLNVGAIADQRDSAAGGNNAFNEMVQRIHDQRDSMNQNHTATLEAAIRAVHRRGFGVSISLSNYLGFTVREIQLIILNALNINHGHDFTRPDVVDVLCQYYLSFQGVEISAYANPGRANSLKGRDMTVHRINLGRVEGPSQNFVYDPLQYDSVRFISLLQDVVNVNGDVESDGMWAWFVLNQASLERRRRPRPATLNALRMYRTAGFDRFIPSDYEGDGFFIPGGSQNCFEACLVYCMEKHGVEEASEKVANMASAFRDRYVSQRIQSSGATIDKIGFEAFKSKVLREYAKMTRCGYSMKLLHKFIEFIGLNYNVYPSVAYVDSGGSLHRKFIKPDASKVNPHIMLVDHHGFLLGSLVEANEDTTSSVSHAIGVWPPFEPNEERPLTKEEILQKFTAVERKVSEVFGAFASRNDPKVLTLADLESLPSLIKCQNDRKKLILKSFQEKRDRINAPPEVRAQRREEFGVTPTFVCVYDIETVENLRGCQDVVYEPFRKSIPSSDDVDPDAREILILPEQQIPYSVQWGLVNFSQQDPPYLFEDEVQIEFGDDQLGKCVEDFLDSLRAKVVGMIHGEESLGAKVFCYAHNGSGFDSFIIKTFNSKFPVEKILVTPRGILSMTILLAPRVRAIFRDTKLFFANKLSELCSTFNVPSCYSKTDFPITLVHARNFSHPSVRESYLEYLRNDVFSLACVVKHINDILINFGRGIADAETMLDEPPITKYVTLMSVVGKLQQNLFYTTLQIPPPIPCDLPAIRKFINYANIGGRVTPYWRGYASRYAKNIIASYNLNQTDYLKKMYQWCKEKMAYTQVLDVTSLYPHVMTDYPMPCVSSQDIEYISAEEVSRTADAIHCYDCETQWRLCSKHRIAGEESLQNLGFVFGLVSDLKKPTSRDLNYYTTQTGFTLSGSESLDTNLIPRKLEKGCGLEYSFLDDEGLRRFYGEGVGTPGLMCYTHYDLYAMKRVGWTFTVHGGFRFATSHAFRDYTLDLFRERIKAKQREKEQNLPKIMSTFYKLIYNGGYGKNAQQDINCQCIVVDQDDESLLRQKRIIKPDEVLLRNSDKTHQLANSQWMMEIQKDPFSCELFADQSPNHIGAAVVATARHYMNLSMMRPCSLGLCGYTDTDSANLHAIAIHHFMPSSIYNETSEAPMGTYKNDHEEGKDEIVILSMFATKKVKLHVTLDADGEIRFYPTFKGFNPSPIDENGKQLSLYEIEKEKVLAIAEIFFEGNMKDVHQTEFRKDPTKGIIIDRNAKFSGNFATFYGHSKGAFIEKMPNGDFVEKLVPVGHVYNHNDDRHKKDVHYIEYWPRFMSNTLPDGRPNMRQTTKKDLETFQEYKEYWDWKERVSFWEGAFGSKDQFYDFVLTYYSNKVAEQMVEDSSKSETFDSFKQVFEAAPKLSDNDNYWQ